MKNLFTILMALTINGLFPSCSEKKESEKEAVTTANVREKVEREYQYPIPTSVEVTKLLQDANAPFVLNITNPVSNIDKYETQADTAMNLEVYGADLSYASTYNMQEATLSLLKALKSLVDGLDIPRVFNDDMVTRVEENLDNKDSMILIITEAFYNTFEEVNQSGQGKIGFLVISASWIEGLYITTQLAISSNYDERLLKIIADQKNTAEILSQAASKYKDDSDISTVAPLIEFLKLTYDNVDPSTGISSDQFSEIASNVESARNEIIK